MSDTENSQQDDKRKYPRIDAAHPAKMKTDGVDAFTCQIKDFCRTGFFVEFDLESNRKKAMILSSLDVSITAKVDFSVAGRLGEKFSVSGTVVRLTENGAGLFTTDMPLNAYEALYMANVEHSEVLDQNSQLKEEVAEELRDKCKVSFSSYIDGFIESFFEQATAALVQQSNAVSFTDRGDYTFAVNLLNDKKDEFSASYIESLDTHFELVDHGLEHEPDHSADKTIKELSLVDKDDFELWLKVSKIVSKVENKFTLVLSKIAKRYQLLSEINIDRKTNPFGPEVLCRELSNQIHKLEVETAISELLSEQMVEQLFQSLPDFYDEIAANLIPLSSLVAAKETAQAQKNADSRHDSEADIKDEEGAVDQQEGNRVSSDVPSPDEYLELPETDSSQPDASSTSRIDDKASGDSDETPVAGTKHLDSQSTQISQLSQQILQADDADIHMVSQALSAANVGAGASQGDAVNSTLAASPVGDGSSLADAQVSQKSSSLGSIASYLSANSVADTSGHSVANRSPTDASGLSLVSSLQNALGVLSATGASKKSGSNGALVARPFFSGDSSVGDQFFQQVSEIPDYRARRLEGESSRLQDMLSQQIESLPATDRVHAQNLVQLIDRTTEDFSPESQLAALISQLDTTLLKLALKDPDFLNSPDHDARQIVDILGEYHISENDDGHFLDNNIQQFLELQVDRVVERSEDDPDVYSEAKTTMVPVLEKARRARELRVASFQQSAEGRDRVRRAREKVNLGLNRILSGRSVPEVLVHLLNAFWRQSMNLLSIRDDADDNIEFQLDVLDMLIDHFETGDTERITLVDNLVLLRDTLKGTCVSSDEFDALFDNLWDSALSAEPQSVRKILVGELEATAEAELTSEQVNLANQLCIGDWWNFEEKAKNSDMQSSGSPRNLCMQLVWMSQSGNRYAFVNRSATNKKEYKIEELEHFQSAGQLAAVGFNSPIFERVENRILDEEYEKVSQKAVLDTRTNLPNRAGFMQHLSSSKLYDDDCHAILICEFDQFRMINNNSGTEAAEQLYVELSQKLATLLSPEDLLSGFNEDTFAILKQGSDLENAEKFAKLLVRELQEYKFEYEDKSYTLGMNIGFGEFHPSHQLPSDAVRKVDSACLAAKDLGRNQAKAYTSSDKRLNDEITVMDWAGKLDQIFEDDSLYLRCQMVLPIGADHDALPYYEVLLGVQDPDGTELQPGWFVSAVERFGRTADLDKWVIENAFNWISENLESFEQSGGFALNLSAISLNSDEVLSFLVEHLKNTKASPEKICFEITETVAISNYSGARRFIERIRQFGCKFCIDDFGSGFASYSYLKNMKTQILKIDGSFIRDLAKNEDDLRIVESMRDVAKSLGMLTVAESVENPSTLTKLKKLGIDYAQGYTIHRPEPLKEVRF